MPLIVLCSGCNTRLTLADDRAGTVLACPKCLAPISVPSPPPPPPPTSGADSHPDLWTPEPAGESATSKLRFRCPACHKLYKAVSTDAGKKTVCKKCAAVVVIPDPLSPKPLRGVPLPPVGDVEPAEDLSEVGDAVDGDASPLRSRPALPPLPPPLPATPPDYGVPPPAGEAEPEDEQSPRTMPLFWRDPVKLSLSVACICGGSALLFVIFIALAFARESPSVGLVLIAMVLFVVSVFSGVVAFQLLVAKQRAIAAKGRPVPLFFGLARLITWEQNEGLIFLRDKRIAETIYGPKSGGGLRIIYPLLGEELRAQVPLTLQLTWFRDERVLTRESIQIVVKVALWWEVLNLEAYFYRIDQEVHALKDKGRPGEGTATAALPTPRGRLGIAEVWVETLAESCLRKLISDTSTFLIISKRAASHLHVESSHAPRVGDPSDTEDLKPATPDVIAEQLKQELQPRLESYGLKVDRVEIQEVQLPPAIQQAVDEVWIASTLPTKSAHEARALEHRLEVLCRMLGKEAVGVSEIMGKLPPGAFMGNPLSWLPGVLEQIAEASKGSSPPMLPPAASPVALPTPPSRPSGP